MTKRTRTLTATAACAFQVTSAGRRVQLLPAGEFRARDGRPKDVPGWRLTDAAAQRLVAAATKRTTPYLIDYEHQTLLASSNGQPAPRAARFSDLEWQPGVGLFATDAEWTARAKGYIEAEEYGFISPVFRYHPQTGEVQELLHAALTNDPALDGMNAVALSAHFSDTEEDTTLNEKQLAALRTKLGLDKEADADAIQAAVVALTVSVANQEGEIAALKASAAKPDAKPDPTQYAPVAALTALQAEVAALKASQTNDQVEELVRAGLNDGRLLESMSEWARDLGKADLAALKGYLDKAAPIAALAGSQTSGEAPPSDGSGALNETQLAVCTAMGLDEDAYKATLSGKPIAKNDTKNDTKETAQ